MNACATIRTAKVVEHLGRSNHNAERTSIMAHGDSTRAVAQSQISRPACPKTSLPEYLCWKAILRRCLNPKCAEFPGYGGRGITVCDRWRLDFWTFYQDVGPKPSRSHELDRINNDGNYEPGNVRWVTRSENDRNRRSNRWVEFHGERRLLIELCEEFGVRPDTARYRLKHGATPEEVFATPVRAKRANGVLAAEKAAYVPKLPRITPERQQEVVRLFVSGSTYDQITAATGVSYNSVGRIIKRHGAKRAKGN